MSELSALRKSIQIKVEIYIPNFITNDTRRIPQEHPKTNAQTRPLHTRHGSFFNSASVGLPICRRARALVDNRCRSTVEYPEHVSLVPLETAIATTE